MKIHILNTDIVPDFSREAVANCEETVSAPRLVGDIDLMGHPDVCAGCRMIYAQKLEQGLLAKTFVFTEQPVSSEWV